MFYVTFGNGDLLLHFNTLLIVHIVGIASVASTTDPTSCKEVTEQYVSMNTPSRRKSLSKIKAP